MSLGDAAAKLNLPVFPCGQDKRPVVETGFKAASSEPARIIAMFERPGAALIGVPTGEESGILVIDIDIRTDRNGMRWLEESSDSLPPTRTHRTQSGGLHLIFRYPAGYDIRNSAGRIAPGIDVRGNGGYVIVPPSPGYVVADDEDPADMPIWLIRACMRPEPQPVQQYTPAQSRIEGGSRYGMAALQAECDAIRSAPFGQQEFTLNAAGLKIGVLIAGGELEDGIALSDLLAAGRTISSEPGRPAWSQREIEDKIRRAVSDGKSRPRSAPAKPMAQRSEDIGEDREPVAVPAERAASPLPLVYFNDIHPVVDVRDFVQGLLQERSAAVIYGESNSGKTFFATTLSLHIASGLTWHGLRVEAGGVVYCVLEGSIGFQNRVSAWRDSRGLQGQDISFAAINSSLNLLDPEADTPKLIQTIQIAAAHMGVPVKLVVIDTLARALAGGNENASEDMGALVMNMDSIRAMTGAAVLFIHHSGKDQAKGARGHSSLRAAVDTEIEVTVSEVGEDRFATVSKQREMRKGQVFPFTLRTVEIGQNRYGEAVTTCVVEAGDEHTAGAVPVRRRLVGHNKRALEILADLVATSGQAGHSGVPPGFSSVPEKWWRDRFYDRAMPGSDDEAKKKAFRRAADALIEVRRVGMASKRVWLTDRKEGHNDVPI